jgi:hypothetical protein
MITPIRPDQQFPAALYVSDSSISNYEGETWEEIKRDPRGLLMCWEPPDKNAKYIMGMDPTEGVTGWTRGTRVDGDHKTDNGVIEVFKVDGDFDLLYKESNGVRIPDMDPATKRQKRRYKDVQVAEFAAPCDAVEIARVANVLGRIYAGEEGDQCTLIWEAWPGPGLLTTQELLRLGYGNTWMWEYIDSVAEETNRMGWRSTPTSQRMLWYRSRRHLMEKRADIKSMFLLEELSNAEIDSSKMRARAAYGYHDDRMQAANMCFWAGHRWTYDVDRTDEQVTTTPEPQDYQRFAPTLDDHKSFADWKSEQLADWDE